ncbi:MAG: MoaD/ThiS family protein [Candidatus Thalassarchaeaceae archaeon]|jgi:sulfur carrier protein ThiS|nr:MoaD/ThiS family protein [Candidatus Thalassarchaeaceae archaeon]
MNSHTVLLFGPLRDKFQASSITIEMPENCSVEDVLKHIGIEQRILKTAVNGTIVPLSTELGTPSEIAVLPPVSGG